MKIERGETPGVTEIKVDDATFILEAPKKTDFFFLATSPDQRELAEFVLEEKLQRIKGVTFEDGQPVGVQHIESFDLEVLFDVVNQYAEKIKSFSEGLAAKKQNGTSES